MQLNASGVIIALERLGGLRQTFVSLREFGGNKSTAQFNSSDHQISIDSAKDIESAARDLGLVLAARQAGALVVILSNIGDGCERVSFGSFEQDQFISNYEALSFAFTGELDQTVAHIVHRNDVAAYHSATSIYGEDTVRKFPSLAHDFEESAKCISLGRGTASVFHAVRCLEAMLRATAKSLGIPDPVRGADRNWSKVLQKIKAEIDVKWPPATRLNGDGPVFGRIHANLSAMQNPYRNSTMHIEASFTEQEARDTVTLIAGVARQIASRLDEDGLPLA